MACCRKENKYDRGEGTSILIMKKKVNKMQKTKQNKTLSTDKINDLPEMQILLTHS